MCIIRPRTTTRLGFEGVLVRGVSAVITVLFDVGVVAMATVRVIKEMSAPRPRVIRRELAFIRFIIYYDVS